VGDRAASSEALMGALESVRFVIGHDGKPSGVFLDSAEWGALLDWLGDVQDVALIQDLLPRLRAGPANPGARTLREVSTEQYQPSPKRVEPGHTANAMSQDLADRIEINPAVALGKPVIRGTRIPVEIILRKLGEGATEADLLDAYPRLTPAGIRAALTYAAKALAHETIDLQLL
jgi:uncharacterized protein (DUF433 family)